MVLYDHAHVKTDELKEKITDLARAGIPQYLIAKICGMHEDTLRKHYDTELACAMPDAIARIAKTVYAQALDGNTHSQALYIKTQGAKFGFVEKHVVENVDSTETEALKLKVAELEGKFASDY